MQKFAFYETIPTKPPGGSDLNQITDQVKLFFKVGLCYVNYLSYLSCKSIFLQIINHFAYWEKKVCIMLPESIFHFLKYLKLYTT